MKVRYLQGMGESRGPGIRPGDIREVGEEEAERLFAREIAVPFEEDDAATEKAIQAVKESSNEAFDRIVTVVVDEASRRGTTAEVSAQEGNLVKDASNDGLLEIATAVRAEVSARELELPPAEAVVPDGVVPGETPGWPIVNGVVIDLPGEIREQLAAKPIASEEEAEMKSTGGAGTTSSKKASSAKTTASARAGGADEATPKKPTGKRSKGTK